MKHKLEKIQPVAIELWEKLKPFCEKIKIAGSIRRQASECKDIEIVLSPANSSARNKIGMFFIQNGRVVKGKFTGRYVKAIYKGFPVDIFIPQKHDYYRQLAIRTGSADYSKRIAFKWKENGYVGTSEGLKEVSNSSEFIEPKTWDSEKHFFEWLGMPYLPPVERF